MRNLTHLFVALILWSLAWLGLAKGQAWAGNLFTFITWAGFAMFIMGQLSKKSRAKLIQSYKDGKHAPLWFDVITYLPLVILCAALANYGKACAWMFCFWSDVAMRNQSSQKQQNQ